MRFKSLFSVAVIVSSLLASCAGNNSEKEKAEALSIDDSLKIMEEMLQKEQAQQSNNDSVKMKEAEEKYEKGLAITPGKKVSKHIVESTCNDVSWTCTVTNNTGVALSPEDYQISYKESYEGQDKEGYLVDKTKTQTMKGPELANDASADVVLKGKECTYDLTKPSVKLTISKEDFIKKYMAEN